MTKGVLAGAFWGLIAGGLMLLGAALVLDPAGGPVAATVPVEAVPPAPGPAEPGSAEARPADAGPAELGPAEALPVESAGAAEPAAPLSVPAPDVLAARPAMPLQPPLRPSPEPEHNAVVPLPPASVKPPLFWIGRTRPLEDTPPDVAGLPAGPERLAQPGALGSAATGFTRPPAFAVAPQPPTLGDAPDPPGTFAGAAGPSQDAPPIRSDAVPVALARNGIRPLGPAPAEAALPRITDTVPALTAPPEPTQIGAVERPDRPDPRRAPPSPSAAPETAIRPALTSLAAGASIPSAPQAPAPPRLFMGDDAARPPGALVPRDGLIAPPAAEPTALLSVVLTGTGAAPYWAFTRLADDAGLGAAGGPEERILRVPDADSRAAMVQFAQALSAAPGFVALDLPSGGALASDAALQADLLNLLSLTGHGLTADPSAAGALLAAARARGIPARPVFARLGAGDGEEAPSILDAAADRARRDGQAIVVVEATADLVTAVSDWLSGPTAARITAAPVSAILTQPGPG